jgi:Cdc6-like AAA superfamily ATPase
MDLTTQHQTHILPAFAFLNDLLRYCLNPNNKGKIPKINKFLLQGGRYSGKSFNVRDIFTTLLVSNIKVVMYINRKLLDDCYKDYQTLCDDMKIKFGEEFFANHFLLSQKPNFSISYGKYNKIIFEPLNEERHKQDKGGKLSART